MYDPNPSLLTIFFLPFFIKYKNVLVILGGLFLYQFVMWSYGIHYSRVFLGSSSIVIIVAILMVDIQNKKLSSFNIVLQNFLKICLVLILSFTILIHMVRVVKLDHPFGEFFTPYHRYQSKCNLLKNRWFKSFNNLLHFYREESCPSIEDAEEIDKILTYYSKPIVGVIASSGRVINILFKNGFFMEYDRGLFNKTDVILVHRGFNKENNLFPDIDKGFPFLLYATANSEWHVLGKQQLESLR